MRRRLFAEKGDRQISMGQGREDKCETRRAGVNSDGSTRSRAPIANCEYVCLAVVLYSPVVPSFLQNIHREEEL